MSEEEKTRPMHGAILRAEEELDLLDLLLVFAKHKKLIIGLPLLIAIITAAVSFLIPNIYTGTARILPPQQQQSSALALLAQLGSLGGLLGAGAKNPSELYVGMLKSRTVADRLIERFKLQQVYDEDTFFETRRALEKVTDIEVSKEGIITVSVEDKDPKRAAAMANSYVEELDRLTQGIAVTEAGQRRLFFERQLKSTKNELAEAEVGLRKTQESSGLIQLEEQARAIITAIATLKGQVIAKEVEVASMRSFATQDNPEFIRAQQQLISLRKELVSLQKKHNVNVDGDVILPTGNIPAAGLDYVRKLRDVKYQETLFELLAKQYELAKIDEAKDAALIQIVDRAIEPDKKSKPKRTLISILAGFGTFVLTVLFVFLREAGQRAAADPEQAARLATLRGYLRFK
jgi:tyrosine-protein kinase Etk/Wzc